MKVHEIYFHDLKPAVQEKIATAHGYASAHEYIIETNDDANPLAIVDIYDKDEMQD
jgi:hypothetical protein